MWFQCVCVRIDNRVGKGLETVWASNNFTRVFNGERCKMTKPAMESCKHRHISLLHFLYSKKYRKTFVIIL